MNRSAYKKSLLLGLALSMVIVVLQYRPMTKVPVAPYSPAAITPATPAPMPARTAIYRVHKKVMTLVTRPVVHAKPSSVELMALQLGSNVREYNYIFSGQTLCGSQACPSTLELSMESPRNSNIHRTMETMADGTFWFQVPVAETSREQVDWKIIAHTREGQSTDMRGHEILTDDPAISVEANLTLR